MLSFSPAEFQEQNENRKHGAEQNIVQIPLQNKVTKVFKISSVSEINWVCEMTSYYMQLVALVFMQNIRCDD